MSKTTIFCIIKSSDPIKEALKERFKELSLNYSNISDDSEKQGHKSDISSLSRYLNKDAYVKGGLSQEHIIWLCVRYSINIKLLVKPVPHNEDQAIKNLKKYFT